MMNDTDTIVAPATPPGRGGVAVVRFSGSKTRDLARAIVGKSLPPRRAVFCRFQGVDGQVIDEGLALFFAAPHSFTGEDVLELHSHGSPMVVDMLLQTGLRLGARLARPGEFSERAFLNDKIDLTQAEAVADLINSTTHGAARAALHSLQGEFSRQVKRLAEELTDLRVYVEAAIDFVDEDIDFLASDELKQRIASVSDHFSKVSASVKQGMLLRDGLTVVLAGKPNAGKSSLLNRLTGDDIAIVTDIPGTTRDVLRAQIQIDGIPLHVIDTAGLRHSGDRIEQEGIERAWREIGAADLVILIVDDRLGMDQQDRALLNRMPVAAQKLIVRNKCDLTGTPPGVIPGTAPVQLALSALTGAGIDRLRSQIKACFSAGDETEARFIARHRHLEALQTAWKHVESGMKHLFNEEAAELFAEELRLAQRALGEITGEVTSDDLLGRIFSTFCIGK